MTDNRTFCFAVVGYRGCGKSWLSRQLAIAFAKWLGPQLALLSCDYLLEAQAQVSIGKMVEKYGWDYFRTLETELLQRIVSTPHVFFTEKKTITTAIEKKIPRRLLKDRAQINSKKQKSNKIFSLAENVSLEENLPLEKSGIFAKSKNFLQGSSASLETYSEKSKTIIPHDVRVCIIDCGGGVVLRSENRNLLKEKCKTVFLNTPLEVLIRRQLRAPRPLFAATLKKDQKRKVSEDEQEKIIRRETVAALKIRMELYQEVANLKINTSFNEEKESELLQRDERLKQKYYFEDIKNYFLRELTTFINNATKSRKKTEINLKEDIKREE